MVQVDKRGRSRLVRAALLSSVLSITFTQGQALAQTLQKPGPAGPGAPGASQDTASAPTAGQPNNEIIVTARKISESAFAVPVVINIVSGADFRRKAINSLDGLTQLVPALIVGEGGSTEQGGEITIRGIGAADTNILGDQAVSFNIDDVQIAYASVRRLSEMDIQQVDVLKGPQVLFYGKDSPAGVISVVTGDPTKTFQSQVSVGYEAEAEEYRTEGYISGPLTDTLSGRIAFFGSTMRGYSESQVPANVLGAPEDDWAPHDTEIAGRLSLKWEPNDRFSARLKLSYDQLNGSSFLSDFQLVNCTLGRPQPISFPSNDDCRADNRQSVAGIPAAFAAVSPDFANGSYLHQYQVLNSLELNARLSDHITATSITGYYDTHYTSAGTSNGNYDPTYIAAYFLVGISQISQEFRLTSDFAGPLNFTAGADYQHSDGITSLLVAYNAEDPTYIEGFTIRQTGDSFSGFGQLRWTITPTLELDGGGRYSYETKALPLTAVGTAAVPLGIPVTPAFSKLSFNDFSPEVTLSWRPTENQTIFGSYRRGFLSGGFNTGSPDVTSPDVKYNPEIVSGGEFGARSRLFDGALRTSLAIYDYEVTGMQVDETVAGTISELSNAGSINMYGVEFEGNYRTPISGLSLNAAVAYNHAYYQQYIASCYGGEAAPACEMRFNPSSGQTALSQNLAGTQVVRAPTWSGDGGFLYETPISDHLVIGLSSDLSFSSSYFTDAGSKPEGRQPAYALLGAAYGSATLSRGGNSP